MKGRPAASNGNCCPLPSTPARVTPSSRQPAAAGVERGGVGQFGATGHPDVRDAGDLHGGTRRQDDRRRHRGGVAVDGDPVVGHQVVETLEGQRPRPPLHQGGEVAAVDDLDAVDADRDHPVRPAAVQPRLAGLGLLLAALCGLASCALLGLDALLLGLPGLFGELLLTLLLRLARLLGGLLGGVGAGRNDGAAGRFGAGVARRGGVGFGAAGVAAAASAAAAGVGFGLGATAAAGAGVGATAAGTPATAAPVVHGGRLLRRHHGVAGRRREGGTCRQRERERADGEARRDDPGGASPACPWCGHAALPARATARMGIVACSSRPPPAPSVRTIWPFSTATWRVPHFWARMVIRARILISAMSQETTT